MAGIPREISTIGTIGTEKAVRDAVSKQAQARGFSIMDGLMG